MRINFEPHGLMRINSSHTLLRSYNSKLEKVLIALHSKMGLDTRQEYLDAIGNIFRDGVAGTPKEKKAHTRRTKINSRYNLISLAKGETILPQAEELPPDHRVTVYYNTPQQEGILPEHVDKVDICGPNHGKKVPIRTVTLLAQPGEELELRIWVTFMLGREEMITDKYFKLPDKFFNNLTARKIENYAKKQVGGTPYTFPSRKSGCDHFINVYPAKRSRNGNMYHLLELGWGTTQRSGWKWEITVAGGLDEPTIRPWVMTSRALRIWKIRRKNLRIHTAVDTPGGNIQEYRREMHDIDVTPLVVASLKDYAMQRDGSEHERVNRLLFDSGYDSVLSYCKLCVHSRMPTDWETAGADRMDGGLWSQGHPVIQRTACVVQDRFLDWHECQEINDGTQETSGTTVTRRGRQIWIAGRWKTFSSNGLESYASGLDYSTYWEREPVSDLKELDDRPYALDDPCAPWNDSTQDGTEIDYDEDNWKGESRLSERFGTPMSFCKRGSEWDPIHGDDNNDVSKRYDDSISLTLGELTNDDEGIAKLEVAIGIRSEFQDAYEWIEDQVANNVITCNHFQGKHPSSLSYTPRDGYAALNKYSFGKLLSCDMRNIPQRRHRVRGSSPSQDMTSMQSGEPSEIVF